MDDIPLEMLLKSHVYVYIFQITLQLNKVDLYEVIKILKTLIIIIIYIFLRAVEMGR